MKLKVSHNDKMNYYNEISKGYEELHKEEQLKKLEVIKEKIEINSSDKLLDVGCGTGVSTEFWNCKKAGIDPAEKLIKIAKAKNTDTEYKIAPAENIPYPENFFDIVISLTAIQNFENIESGLKEIKRVGKENFVLSFLKKAEKAEKIENLIENIFDVKEKIEEEKDFIYFTKINNHI